MNKLRLGLSVLFAWLAFRAQPSEAQSFALPIDVHQGLALGAARPRTPYVFEARLSPGIDFGPVRVAAVVAPSYLNPRWDVALGGEVSLFGVLALRRFGLRLALEGSYFPVADTGRVSMGLIGEAFGLLRIGIWPGLALDSRRVVLTTSLGFDVMSWIDLARRD